MSVGNEGIDLLFDDLEKKINPPIMKKIKEKSNHIITYRDVVPLPFENLIKPLQNQTNNCPFCDILFLEKDKEAKYFTLVGNNSLPKTCSFLKRLFGCKEKRNHLHQKCSKCKSKWIVAPYDINFR